MYPNKVDEVQKSRNKKAVIVNGKPAVQIQEALKAEEIEKEIEKLCTENETLKTLLGLKRGSEAYIKGEDVEYKEAAKRFERFLAL